MDLTLAEDVKAQLDRCQALLDDLEDKAKPFLNRTTKDIDAVADPVESAQVYLALARTINSLFELYLKASGVPPEELNTAKERERLRAYEKKVRKVMAGRELSQSRRSVEVNVAALNRVITNAVPDLSAGQKQALKQAAASKKKGAGEEAAQGAGAEANDAEAGGRKRARRSRGGRDEALAFLEEAFHGGSAGQGRGSSS